MDSASDFEKAAEAVKTLSKKPSNDTMLKIYGLYKQATVGDVNTSKPGILDQKGRAKWSAWEKNKGMSQDDAKSAYVELVNSLL